MSQFIGDLDLRVMGDRLWMTLAPFSYKSDLAGIIITVPAGFKTDLLSTWSIPVAAELFDGTNAKPAVIHDYLYSCHLLNRELSDEVLQEACQVNGSSFLEAKAIYEGVRVGGGSHWGPSL